MPQRRNRQEQDLHTAQAGEMNFQVTMDEIRPSGGMLATASVKIGNVMTIRNVKIKESDYGTEVVMPRTKMPHTGEYKDSMYFDSREMREQFDKAVMNTYEQYMEIGETETIQENENEEEYEEENEESQEEEQEESAMRSPIFPG